MKVAYSDKYTSLLHFDINYCSKSIYRTGLREGRLEAKKAFVFNEQMAALARFLYNGTAHLCVIPGNTKGDIYCLTGLESAV